MFFARMHAFLRAFVEPGKRAMHTDKVRGRISAPRPLNPEGSNPDFAPAARQHSRLPPRGVYIPGGFISWEIAIISHDIKSGALPDAAIKLHSINTINTALCSFRITFRLRMSVPASAISRRSQNRTIITDALLRSFLQPRQQLWIPQELLSYQKPQG